jgi:folate-binding protein YgfZ
MTKALLTFDSPSDYGDPVAEYAALLKGAALVDRSPVGKVRVAGADGLDLLNRLSSNNLNTLPVGEGMATVVTTSKGRVVDLLTVTARPDHLLYLTSPGRQSAVMEWIDFYTFAEDVTPEDVTGSTAMFSLAGPKASSLLASLGIAADGLPRFHSREASVAGADGLLWHTLGSGDETYELVAPLDQASRLWDGLAAAGAVPAGHQAWEAHRVARGVPVFGAEFGEETNPLESRLKGAISFNKICYIGQEVVARLNTYSKVQRRLMAATLTGPAKPGAGLLSEGRSVGRLTSVAQVPSGDYVALAMVRREHAEAGQTLAVAGDVTATLAEPAYALATEPAEE